MRAKEFFQSVWKAEQQIKLLQAQIQHFEDLGLSISSKLGGVPGKSGNTSRVEASAIGIYDSTAKMEEEIRCYMELINLAKDVISKIPQERYRKLLTLHYLCGWSPRSISDELEYDDPNSVYRAKGWALAEAQKILNQEDRNTT